MKNIDEILENKIIVLNRDNIDINKYLDQFDKSKFIVVSDFPFINVSSTEIRKGNHKYLKEEVKEYITKNNLYK